MHHLFEPRWQKAIGKLQRLVELRAAKGGLSVTDREMLRNEAEALNLGREDVDRLMAAFPPWPEPPARQELPVSALEQVEPWEWAELEHRLDELNLRDLYEVLKVGSDAEASTLEERLQELSRNPDRDPVKEETRRLADRHLGTAQARARYDRSLMLAQEANLAAMVCSVVRGQSRVDTATRRALLAEGVALGIDPERSAAILDRTCREQGIGIEVPSNEPSQLAMASLARWLRCSQCGGLTQFDAARSTTEGTCVSCHGPLRWECPLCQRSHWADEPRCECHFARDDVRPLVERFEAAQQAFRLRRFREALGHLRYVRKLAPLHVGARKGLEKVQQQIGEIRRVRAAFQQEFASHRLVGAMAQIERWGRLASPTDTRLKSALEQTAERLAKARSMAHHAGHLSSSDPRAARHLYHQALELAADLPEAVNGLQHCPPDGPVDFSAHNVSGGIRLRWKPPAPDGLGPCHFLILRQPGSKPTHVDDGTLMAEVTETEWTDTQTNPGSSYGYAVFAVRNLVRSVLGMATGPILATEPVRQVHIEPDRETVRLRWVPPAAAAAIRVVRKDGAPVKNPRDGAVLPCNRDTVIDTPLIDGHIYHYAIYALFRSTHGKLHPAQGVHFTAVPGRPPDPVMDLRVIDDRAGGHNPLMLGWTPASRGKVRLARLAELPPWKPGDRRRPADFEYLGAAWIEEAAPGRAIDEDPNPPRPSFYIPLVLQHGLATMGEPLAYAYLPDPSHLVAHRDRQTPEQVFLSWRWPAEAITTRCLVVARTGRPASSPLDTDSRTFVIERSMYERKGLYKLKLPPRADLPWFVSVYTQCELNGEPWISSGHEPSSRTQVPDPGTEVLVYYKISPGGVARPWSLHIRTDPSGVTVGPTVLVAQPRILPLTPREGLTLARFPQARDGDTLRFEPATRLEGRKLRLFADPENTSANFALIRLCLPD